MFIVKSISEDNYAEIVDCRTNNIRLIDPYEKSMLDSQCALTYPETIEKLEFLLGIYEQNRLHLIARHRDELTNTIATAYSTKKYITAVEKCNNINVQFRRRGYSMVCTVIPKSRAKAILSLNRADKRASRNAGGK